MDEEEMIYKNDQDECWMATHLLIVIYVKSKLQAYVNVYGMT